MRRMIQTTETAPPTVAQWPSELTNAGVFMDLQDITADISRHSNRLFASPGKTACDIFWPGNPKGSHVNNTEEIENALLESSDASIRFIFISQPYSWARLNITEECLRATLSILKVMPEFWYILRAFGSKNEPIDESFGGFYEAVGEENAELCYLVKHVEENKRDEVLPWSNRQVGVYQQTHLKSDGLTHSNTFIIVNPSRNCCKLLEQLCSKQEQYHNAETVHTIVASSLTAQWKAYINCSESKLLKFNGMNMATSNELKDLNYVDFKLRDAQYAYDMRDSILQVLSLLQINLVVFPKVQRLCKAHRQRFQNAITEMELQQKRLEVVLNRVIASIALFENIMESRAASRIKENVEELRKQGWLAKDQAAKALEDARTVKALTFLAMAFIPPTFASQVLGMGFITVDDHPRRWELHFSAELYIFLIFAALCTLLTVLVWKYLTVWRVKPGPETRLTPPRTSIISAIRLALLAPTAQSCEDQPEVDLMSPEAISRSENLTPAAAPRSNQSRWPHHSTTTHTTITTNNSAVCQDGKDPGVIDIENGCIGSKISKWDGWVHTTWNTWKVKFKRHWIK